MHARMHPRGDPATSGKHKMFSQDPFVFEGVDTCLRYLVAGGRVDVRRLEDTSSPLKLKRSIGLLVVGAWEFDV